VAFGEGGSIDLALLFIIGTRVADFSLMMANPAEPKLNETETLTRILDLELAQKRATWKQAGERARSIRAAGFVFLFFLILGCLVGGYFVFMRVNEQRPTSPPRSAIDH
jgi:hypothetical protein